MPSPDLDTSTSDDLASLEALIRRAVRAELTASGDRPPAAPLPLYDLDGAAARLNVSTRTVEALVASGELPVTRIGTGRGVRRFDPAALDAFVRRQTRVL